MNSGLVGIAEPFGDPVATRIVGVGDADPVPSRLGPWKIVRQKPIHAAGLDHGYCHAPMMTFFLVGHKNQGAGGENLPMDPDPPFDRNQGMISRSAAENTQNKKHKGKRLWVRSRFRRGFHHDLDHRPEPRIKARGGGFGTCA